MTADQLKLKIEETYVLLQKEREKVVDGKIKIDIVDQLNKLETVRSTGAVSSVVSVLASISFLIDAYLKIVKPKREGLNDHKFDGRDV